MSSVAAHPLPPDLPAAPAGRRAAGLLARLPGARGVWALGDQGILSLGNFLTSILLARYWHDRLELYGLYALCLSVVNFLNTLHASVVTYPLTVLGAACDDKDPTGLRRLTGRALGLTLLLAPVLALGLLYPTITFGRLSLLPWVAAALLFWQAQETVRRAMLSRLRHDRAVPGDAISYLGQAAVVWLLARSGRLTPELAFIAIGATSAIAAVVQMFQLRAAPGWLGASAGTAARESWRLGRWLLLANVVNLGLVYVTPWLLSGMHGAGQMARFSALATVLGVTNPVVMSTCGLIVPAVAAARAAGRATGRRAAVPYALQGMALLLPYYALLLVAPQFVLRVFYGANSPYLELGPLLRLFAAGYGGAFVAQVLCAVLNGTGDSRGTFLATVVAAVTNVAIAIPLVRFFGLRGSVWAGLGPIAAQVCVAALLVYWARGRRRTEGARPPGAAWVGRPAENALAGGVP